MPKLMACITFDVDFVEHTRGGVAVDEFDVALPVIWSLFQRHPDWKATWFVRLDAQMSALYRRPDYLFQRYATALDELQQAGHEVGWHPHCYVYTEGQWQQNTDTLSVVHELNQCAPVAKSYGLQSARLGWGFHTNATMAVLAEHDFMVDSSAIPRPRYPWEQTEKDWTITPVTPYFPSISDYRMPGQPELPILEVPMSVAHIQAPGDTGQVLRYINLAYRPELLLGPLELWLTQYSHLITVTHPYELIPHQPSHGLLAFEVEAFEQNLVTIQEFAMQRSVSIAFLTISEFARQYVKRDEEDA